MSIRVREAQVEDVLATYPDIFASLIGLKRDVRLLFRQHPLSSGRLDLLYTSGVEFLLVELKVEPFQGGFLNQVLAYATDIRALQEQGALIKTPVKTYLLCTSFFDRHLASCYETGVIPVVYSPDEVLQAFFFRLQGIARFVSIKPTDHGLWNIHLIHRALYGLPTTSVLQELSATSRLSPKTVMNHLRFAGDLLLVSRRNRNWTLSELGVRYVAARDPRGPLDTMSEGQRQILREVIIKDPFASPTIFGVYEIVECVFTLARNSYPVDESTVFSYFRDTCGKATEWVTQTSLKHGVRMYSNYAIELGLLAKVNNRFLLTPDGVRFVLLLQLHKGIAMVDALSGHSGA